MGTVTEVQLESLHQQEIESKGPRSYRARLLGISLLTAIWIWAAFARGRGFHLSIQILVLVTALAVVAGFLWLSARIISSRFLLSTPESRSMVAFASGAFLLLAVFFPEYLLGKPALIKSFLLPGFALLLFALYLALSLKETQPALRLFRVRFSAGAALFIFCAAYFLASTWLALVKLHAFGYVGQDIAYFTQCLHTTLHGHLFYSNLYHDLLYGKAVSSDFAGHNQPVLFLFLPFYLLHKSASTLLVVRNIFVVLCAWPVFLIARRMLPGLLAAAAAVAFLLLPAVLYQNFYDFAPLSLAALPLLFAIYFFLEHRFKPFLIALICAQLVREDLVFAVFGLGLLALWQRRSLRWIAVPCGLALLWGFFSWQVLFPYFQHGATSAVASCFSYLGATPLEMLKNVLRHPGLLLSHTNVVYTKQMVDSLGGALFLFNPVWIISVPYLGINVLGQGGGCNTAMIYRHYSLIPAVFLFASVLLGLERVGKFAKRGGKPETLQGAVILFVLMAALSSTVFVSGRQQFDELQARPWHQEAVQVATMLPSDASVAVPRYMLPSVANRGSLYQSLRLLEYHHPDAAYIVIDKDWQRLAATEQWRENYDTLRRLLETSVQYKAIYNSPNYVIYKLCDGCAPNLPHREPMKEMHD